MKINLKKLVPIIVLILIALAVFLNSDTFSQKMYLSKGDLTRDVMKETLSYRTAADEADYLVYFYDMKQCEKCGEYINELKKYEKMNDSFPVYKVNLAELKPKVLTDQLFVDPSHPYIFHVKGGDDFYSYIGGFSAEKLPNEKQQADPL